MGYQHGRRTIRRLDREEQESITRGIAEAQVDSVEDVIRMQCALDDALHLLETTTDRTVAWNAGRDIASIGSRSATRRLTRIAVRPETPWRQHEAVYTLWFLRDPRCRWALRWVVDSPQSSAGVRGLAAEALGMYKDSLPFLLGRIQHPLPDVRCGALYGICVITTDAGTLSRCEFLLDDEARLEYGGETVCSLARRVLRPELEDCQEETAG